MKKKALSLALALALCLGLMIPVSAIGTTVTVTDNRVGNVTTITNVVGKVVRSYLEYGELQDYTIYVVGNEGCAIDVVAAPGVSYAESPGDGWDDEADYAGITIMSDDWSAEVNEFTGWLGDNIELASPIHREFGPYAEGRADDYFVDFGCSGGEPSLHLFGGAVWMYEGAFNKIVSSDGRKGLTATDRLTDDTAPTTPTTPAVTVEDIPARGTAKVKNQNIEIDGKKVAFQTYMLLNANGDGTNYVKLRDIAHVLNGTKAQFSVDYDQATKSIAVTTGAAYQDDGSEMSTPFSGNRDYKGGAKTLRINGVDVPLTAITLKDDSGGGYTYFKLRDLGKVLGFNVDWSKERGVFVESGKPYTE